MKVMKKLKTALVLVFSLVLVSCGSDWTSSAGTYTSTSGTCSISESGTNVYTGTVYSDLYGTNSKGTLKLQINQGGTMASSFTANAYFVLNGTTYCCSTNGGTYILGTSGSSNVNYTLDGVTLYCYPTNSSGSYGYVALTIGESYMYMYDVADLTSDNRIEGIISVTGGQNLSSYSNEYYYWVE